MYKLIRGGRRMMFAVLSTDPILFMTFLSPNQINQNFNKYIFFKIIKFLNILSQII